jgi:hypothetical protein
MHKPVSMNSPAQNRCRYDGFGGFSAMASNWVMGALIGGVEISNVHLEKRETLYSLAREGYTGRIHCRVTLEKD